MSLQNHSLSLKWQTLVRMHLLFIVMSIDFLSTVSYKSGE